MFGVVLVKCGGYGVRFVCLLLILIKERMKFCLCKGWEIGLYEGWLMECELVKF